MAASFKPEVTLLEEHAQLLQRVGGAVNGTPKVGPAAITANDALIVVDMQNDFVPAKDAPLGGRFAVPVSRPPACLFFGLSFPHTVSLPDGLY
jgi:hypothetical protein